MNNFFRAISNATHFSESIQIDGIYGNDFLVSIEVPVPFLL